MADKFADLQIELRINLEQIKKALTAVEGSLKLLTEKVYEVTISPKLSKKVADDSVRVGDPGGRRRKKKAGRELSFRDEDYERELATKLARKEKELAKGIASFKSAQNKAITNEELAMVKEKAAKIKQLEKDIADYRLAQNKMITEQDIALKKAASVKEKQIIDQQQAAIIAKQKADVELIAKLKREAVWRGADKQERAAISKKHAAEVRLSKLKIANYRKQGNFAMSIEEKGHLKRIANVKEYAAIWQKTGVKKYTNAAKEQAKADRQAATAKMNVLKQQQNLNHSLDVAIGKLIRYRIAFGAMLKMYQAFTGSIKTFIEVNYQLAQISKIIQPTKRELSDIKDLAFDLAKVYGRSIGQVLDSFKIWGQMGLRQKDLQNAVNATLVAANAIGMEAKEVTEDLTAAIFSYNLETEDLITVVDRWMAVQRQYPITAADLANGMKKVGVAARILGIDMDNLNGMLTAIVAVTRKTGTEVGTSLKTMFARFPRRAMIQALQDIDIFMLQTATTYRSMSVVLDELAVKWRQLTDVEQTNIAQKAAGVRRYVDFVALMDNYSVKVAATATSQAAFGEALKANQREMETFKKQFEILSVTFGELGEQFGGTLAPVMKDFIWISKQLVKAFSNKTVMAFGKSLLIVAGAFLVLKAAQLGFRFAQHKVQQGLLGTMPVLEATKVQLYGVSGAAITAASSMNALTAAASTAMKWNWILLGASALAAAFYLFKDSVDESGKSLKKFSKLSSSIEDFRTIDRQIKAYKTLKTATKDLISERTELINQLRELTKDTSEYSSKEQQLIVRGEELARMSDDVAAAFRVMGEQATRTLRTTEALRSAFVLLQDEQERNIQLAETVRRRMMAELLGERTVNEAKKVWTSQQEAAENYLTVLPEIKKIISDLVDTEFRFDKLSEAFDPENLVAADAAKVENAVRELIGIFQSKMKIIAPLAAPDEGLLADLFEDVELTKAQETAVREAINNFYDEAIKASKDVPAELRSIIGNMFTTKGTTTDLRVREAAKALQDYVENAATLSTLKPKFAEIRDAIAEIGLTAAESKKIFDLLVKTDKIFKPEGLTTVSKKYRELAAEFDKWKSIVETGVAGMISKELRLADLYGTQTTIFKERGNIFKKVYGEGVSLAETLKKEESDLLVAISKASEELIKQPELKKVDVEEWRRLTDSLEQYREDLTEVRRLLRGITTDSSGSFAALESGMKTLNAQNKITEKIIRNMKFSYQDRLSLIKAESKFTSTLHSDQRRGLQQQIGLTQKLYNEVNAIVRLWIMWGLAQSELTQSQEKFSLELESSIRKLQRQLNALDYEKQSKGLIDFTNNLRSAFGTGLGDIQSRWISATEQRVKLQEDLIDAQDELREATDEYNEAVIEGQETSNESILEAQREIRELERQIKDLSNAFEILGQSIRDAFLQLSDMTFRNLMEQIAKDWTADIISGTKGVGAGGVPKFALPDIDAEGNAIKGAKSYNKEIMAGSILAGQALGQAAGVGIKGAGAAAGAAIGSAIGSTLGTGLGAFGAIGFGLIGGVLGALLDKQEDVVKENIVTVNKNSDAVNANTKALEELSKLVINVPTRFRLPPIGGGEISGGGVTISNLTVGGGSQGASDFLDILQQYGVDLRSTGSRTRVVI